MPDLSHIKPMIVALTPEAASTVENALVCAHEFIVSVTAWTGHEDDLAEALGILDDATDRMNEARERVARGSKP